MTDYVIGIDPGDSTGLALFIDGRFTYARQDEPPTILTELEVLLTKGCRDGNWTTIGIERFTPGRKIMTHQPIAQQVIGAVDRMAQTYGAHLVLQGAADAHGIANNELLRKLGLFQTKNDVQQPDALDANMAVRHALLTLSRQYATQFEALLAKAG